MNNRINVKNVHYAKNTTDESGVVTREKPKSIAGAMKVSTNPKLATGQLYGDGALSEDVSKLTGCDISVELNRIPTEIQNEIFGKIKDRKRGETVRTGETLNVAEDGYVHLELRYNTYEDVTDYWGWGRVSYNLEKFFPTEKDAESTMKGFKVTINSREHGEGRVIVLDLNHPVGVPEAAKDVHSTSSIR